MKREFKIKLGDAEFPVVAEDDTITVDGRVYTVEVTEEGTEAGAATAVPAGRSALTRTSPTLLIVHGARARTTTSGIRPRFASGTLASTITSGINPRRMSGARPFTWVSVTQPRSSIAGRTSRP